MNTKHLKRLAISAAIAATLVPALALAQDDTATQDTTTPAAQTNRTNKPDATKAKNLDQVVVTGTRPPAA